MWFKQIQLFQLTDSLRFTKEQLSQKLEPLAFKPCLPSMFSSMGWASPVDEEGEPLIRLFNGCFMLCLQIEEKILPASVIRQELYKKIKERETNESRKVYQKEKMALKDEMIITLLPRAFTKITRVYAYIDTNNQWLVLGTTQAKKIEQFIAMFKKSVSENIFPFDLQKISPIMTHWIKSQNYPTSFSIEKKCMLQDPAQQNRIIRCQQQDLFASSIQALIKDGCEIKQLSLNWHDRIEFMLSDNFSLSVIKYQDEMKQAVAEMEAETKQQQFDADFLIMTETLSALLKELLNLFIANEKSIEKNSQAVVHA